MRQLIDAPGCSIHPSIRTDRSVRHEVDLPSVFHGFLLISCSTGWHTCSADRSDRRGSDGPETTPDDFPRRGFHDARGVSRGLRGEKLARGIYSTTNSKTRLRSALFFVGILAAWVGPFRDHSDTIRRSGGGAARKRACPHRIGCPSSSNPLQEIEPSTRRSIMKCRDAPATSDHEDNFYVGDELECLCHNCRTESPRPTNATTAGRRGASAASAYSP